MIFPGQICTYVADSSLPWKFVWLEFDGLKAKELLDTAGFSVNSPIYRPRFKDTSHEMAEEMMYIAKHPKASHSISSAISTFF